MKDYYFLSAEETLKDLNVTQKGLSEQEVTERQLKYADMQLDKPKHKSLFAKFLAQFADLMILILLVAAGVSIVIAIVEKSMSELIDGVIILFIVLMNAIFGVIQENKAEKSMEALRSMTEPEAVVKRNDEAIKVNTKEIVPGDIVILEAGSIVPADLRLIESVNLKIDEASLTGESFPSEKNAEITYKENTPLADRKNMAYKGTTVVGGRAIGVVTSIGKGTELGKIAKAITETEKELTPLQKSIKSIGKILTILVLAVAAITFVVEVIARPNQILEAFLTAVAISVAAIPESLPAVITIIMSLGISRLSKNKAIIKRMHAVETLGSCDVICSDKTGTITQNKMTVEAVYYDQEFLQKDFAKGKDFEIFARAINLCNDTIKTKGVYVGDPTETALSNFTLKFGYDKKKQDEKYKRIGEITFDSNRKLMSTIHNFDKEAIAYTKGAFDNLMEKCNKILLNGKEVTLTNEIKKSIIETNKKMGSMALRVLGVAYKKMSLKDVSKFKEENLVFVGLVGMIDPPRKEISRAVSKCQKAGMRAVMITGDHRDTAFAIANKIGIAKSEDEVLTGLELDKLSDEEFLKVVEKVSVYARVSPENKVRIVETLKKNGHVVAMTGDGVNDAPSLKKASIGIGMGITGTDVTKEVADLIITDDNFATIIVAVEEGRKIYSNIQKTIKFLFSANMSEILGLFICTIFFPQYTYLYPVQILFINLITDSLPAIAIGVEEAEKNIMDAKPRKKDESIFGDGVGKEIIYIGALQTILTISAFIYGFYMHNAEVATTMAFYTLNLLQIVYMYSARTKDSMFKSNPFKNKMMNIASIFAISMLLLIIFTPAHNWLQLTNLNIYAWLVIIGMCLLLLAASEIYELVGRKLEKRRNEK